ncbi:MAG: hypothetical protein AAGI38_22185 [Bacteroidota bacterium]
MQYTLARAIACLLLGSLCLFSHAQESEARKYSNEFLKIGVGARAFGMGKAQTAVSEDVTAGYWNPAGLASSGKPLDPELSLMHAAYFANIANYNHGGFSMPIDSAGQRWFGLTLIRIGVDDIPNTLQLRDSDGSINLDRIQSFSASDFAAMFSYAWRPGNSERLSLGTNFKIIYRGVGRFANAWGFGLDLAVRYKVDNLQLGLVINDATNTFNAWTFNTETFEDAFINTGNEVPQNSVEITRPSARLGIAYDLQMGRRFSALLALDTDVFFDGNRSASLWSGGGVSIDPHAGVELAYKNEFGKKIAFLRGGFYNLQYFDGTTSDTTPDGDPIIVDPINEIFPTAGVGVLVKNFQIDYALANIGDFSANLHSHVVSIRFAIK